MVPVTSSNTTFVAVSSALRDHTRNIPVAIRRFKNLTAVLLDIAVLTTAALWQAQPAMIWGCMTQLYATGSNSTFTPTLLHETSRRSRGRSGRQRQDLSGYAESHPRGKCGSFRGGANKEHDLVGPR